MRQRTLVTLVGGILFVAVRRLRRWTLRHTSAEGRSGHTRIRCAWMRPTVNGHWI